LLQDLMSGARLLGVLIELETRPIEGSYHEFVGENQIEGQQAKLLKMQELTRDIAIYNNDFALADFVLNQMAIDSVELEKGLKEIDASRVAVLTARGIEIEDVLKEIRDGLGRRNRPKHLPDLEEYIQNISSYSDPQTFLAISRALSGLFAFDLTKGRRSWTGAQRDEIIFCCRVLGYLKLPEMTVTALDMAGEALTDERLLVEVGRALCRTKHYSAEAPIERLRARLKDKAHVWAQILELYKMVPNSPLPENPSAEDILTRAEIMIVKEQPIAARKLLEPRASELTDSSQFHYLLGLTWGAGANGVMHMHRAIELDSKNIKSHQRLAGYYAYMKKADKAEELALKSITLAPDDWRSWHVLGFVYTLGGASKWQDAITATTRALELNPQNYAAYTNRAAMYINLEEFEKAELDLSRALYFNPRHAEAYINRSICRRNLGDIDGAIQDCNRLLEFFPDHMWGILNRADAYFELEEYNKAVLDYSVVIERGGGPLVAAYFGRAKSYQKIGNLDAAADDMYDFLDDFPDHNRTAEAEALLAGREKEMG
ncbi:MAG: tetratricopeptide repeat protein, partial [Planctomycetes bacterium]|nr:tetratricopeptide repeat protein [Planctomycetota bacterium]